MTNYIAIQDLDLSNATVIGFNNCAVEVHGGDLVCVNYFGDVVAKFPFELNSRYLHLRGLPNDICIDEDGNFDIFNFDEDDEDYEEDQPVEILNMYSYITAINFTIIFNNEQD